MDLKAKEVSWLIGRKSHLTTDNKLLIYKAVIQPIWMYGCELWECASKTNIHIIQRFQSKILREIANAPWFVSNHTLHTDFQIPNYPRPGRHPRKEASPSTQHRSPHKPANGAAATSAQQ
jgi:hypothetical protein